MNSRTRSSGVRGVTHSSSLRGEPCTKRVCPSPSTSRTTYDGNAFTKAVPSGPCCAASQAPRSLSSLPSIRSALPRTKCVGRSIARTSSSVSFGSGPHVRSPQKTIASTRSPPISARTASSAAALPCTSGRAATRIALRAADDRELVLGVADALLDLPTVSRRLAGLDLRELLLRRLQLLLGAHLVDVVRLDGVVDERDRTILQHLEEARAGRELEHLVLRDVYAGRACLQRRDQRRVPREDADLARGARHDDHLGVALVGGAVRRHQRDREFLAVGHLRSARRSRRTSASPARPRPRSARPCRRPARAARRAGPRGSP